MRRCGLGLAAALSLACWQGALAGQTLPARSWSPPLLHPTAAHTAKPGTTAPETMPPLPVRKNAKSGQAAGDPAAAEPNVWPAHEIAAAQARCTQILKEIGAAAVPQPPIKEGKCGTPAPIRLVSLGKKARVTFEPATLVNCDMAAALSKWISDDVQPLARKHLGARITKIEVMSDYSCRTAFGRVGHRLSEHAYADAVDIRGFVTDKGEKVHVLNLWGETERDVAAKIMAAAPVAKTARIAGQGKDATVLLPVSRKAASAPLKLAASHLGGPQATEAPQAQDKPTKVAALSPLLPAPTPLKPQSKFLREAHAAACRIFGTALGPEANEAHRNHFHVDMAQRKIKNICD